MKKKDTDDAGTPVYIQHGSHAHKNNSLGTPVYIQHGSHAHKKKKLTEETVSAGLSVRGFGDVSGNPAVQSDPLQQYVDTNMLAKDDVNGALMKMMKDH